MQSSALSSDTSNSKKRSHSVDLSQSRQSFFGEQHSTSVENEFWDNDPHLIARCMLSKGRRIYKDSKNNKQESDQDGEGQKLSSIRVQKTEKKEDEEDEEPKDYEVFLDIKNSYETSLAKMDVLCKKLQMENRTEKLKRLKF